MTTEQEFFEAFGVKKIKPNDNNCKYCRIVSCPEYFDCKHMIYPPITPEIVLKLINIFLKKYGTFKFWICPYAEFTDSDGLRHKHIDCIIAETKEGNSNVNAVEISETRALLKLCIVFQNEIQDQVRGIFNE